MASPRRISIRQPMLAAAGAKLYPENQVIGIPASLVHKALESVPREFYLYDYEGNPVVHYGGDSVHFDPGSSGIAMLNPETLEHETTETAHLIRLLKIAEQIPQYDAQSTAVICHEVPKEIQDLLPPVSRPAVFQKADRDRRVHQ